MLWIIFPPTILNGNLPHDVLFIVVVLRVSWAAAALESGGAMKASLIGVGETRVLKFSLLGDIHALDWWCWWENLITLPSSDPPSNSGRWYNHRECADTHFNGWKGLICPITAFNIQLVVFSTGGGGGIMWTQRSTLHQWSGLVAEMIQIDYLVGDGWIHIVLRRLDVLLWKMEVPEGCHSKSIACDAIVFMVRVGSWLEKWMLGSTKIPNKS